MSFFSFQDIIACTTGIMVLITLMLTMELMTKTLDGGGSEDLTPLVSAVAAAEKKRDEMNEEIARMQAALDEASTDAPVTEGMIEAIERAVRNLKRENEAMAGTVARTDDERLKLVEAIAETAETVRVLREDNGKLKEKLEENKKKTPVTVIGGEAETKRVLCVEVSQAACVVASIAREGENSGFAEKIEQFDGPDSHLTFLTWASRRSPAQDCFVLLIRPDAVEKWQIVAGELKARQFNVGWDVWPADKSLLGEP